MRRLFSLTAWLALLFSSAIASTQDLPPDAEDVEVGYIYATVMGTGSYKINGRRITMLSIPLAYTRRNMTPDRAGLEWTMPLVLGYDAVTEQDWFGQLLEEDLVTLTALPGLEYQLPIHPNWTLKPFGNIGLGHDFAGGETIWMGVLGIRALGTWRYPEGWELRLGAAFQTAGEYQHDSHNRTSFGMLEGGIDVRWTTPLVLADRGVDTGVYYLIQHFLPEWDIDQLRPRKSEVGLLHEVGLSIGLKKPISFLGVEFARLRVGYSRGSGVRGWTFGTDFPF
mgnify:FL=1